MTTLSSTRVKTSSLVHPLSFFPQPHFSSLLILVLDALMLYQRARDIREHALGKAHPDYAQSVKNIASLYQDQRRYSDAERLFKEYSFMLMFQRGLDSLLKKGSRHHGESIWPSPSGRCNLPDHIGRLLSAHGTFRRGSAFVRSRSWHPHREVRRESY